MEGLACSIRAMPASSTPTGSEPVVDVHVTNTGSAVWLPADAPHGGVSLGAHLYDAAGTLLRFDALSQPLAVPPREISPGETVDVVLRVPTPGPGRYRLELDCVADGVAWFAQLGSHPVMLPIEIAAATGEHAEG